MTNLSAQTLFTAVTFGSMVPLSIFFVYSYEEEWTTVNDNYSSTVYWFTGIFSLFAVYAIYVTYSIDGAYKKDLNWMVKRPWLLCFIMAQSVCIGLDTLIFAHLLNSTILKLRWNVGVTRYALDTKMSDFDNFCHRMKNYYLLEKPSIIFPMWMIVTNMIIFTLLLAFSVMHDVKKAKDSSRRVVELDDKKDFIVFAEETFHTLSNDPNFKSSKCT